MSPLDYAASLHKATRVQILVRPKCYITLLLSPPTASDISQHFLDQQGCTIIFFNVTETTVFVVVMAPQFGEKPGNEINA